MEESGITRNNEVSWSKGEQVLHAQGTNYGLEVVEGRVSNRLKPDNIPEWAVELFDNDINFDDFPYTCTVYPYDIWWLFCIHVQCIHMDKICTLINVDMITILILYLLLH